MDAKLRKALERVRAADTVRESDDKELAAEYPLLAGFMTSTEGIEKGTFREPGTLFLFVKDGTWKGVLGEKNPKASLWGQGDSFRGLLTDLERALGSEQPDWRVESPTGRYSVPKAKKGKGR